MIQETIEDAAELFADDEPNCDYEAGIKTGKYQGFIAGSKWQQEHYGLMEIELSHTKRLLASCEKALEDRDKRQERMYSEEDMRLAIKKARDISNGKDCFDAEDISGCTEVCTYDWRFNMSEDSIIEQFKKK